MSGLDFPNTCPMIDENIEKFKDIISGAIDDIVDEISPKFYDTNEYKLYSREHVDKIYKQCEYIFEELRQSNTDIRYKSENIIEELENEIEELQNPKPEYIKRRLKYERFIKSKK